MKADETPNLHAAHLEGGGYEMNSSPATPVALPMRLLDATAASEMLGLSRGTLYNLRSAGTFAPAIVLGRGALRWEAEDLLTWARQYKEGAAA